MTTPTHTSSIPAGGILTQHVDNDWADYSAGRPLQQRICIAVLQPAGIRSSNTQKGRSKGVAYEDVHFVEVTDEHEADRLRRLITVTKADRGLLASQPALFDLTEAEQCDSLIDMIKEYASEEDIPIKDLDKRFWGYFGGAEAQGLSKTIQACRSPLQLKEFAYEIGAIADETPEEPAGSGVAPVAFADGDEPENEQV